MELVQSVCLIPAMDLLEDRGVNVDKHLKATGLQNFATRTPSAWLPKSLVFDFINRVDRYELSDRPIDDLEPSYRLQNTHHYGQYLLSSKTMLEAARRVTSPKARVLSYHRVNANFAARPVTVISKYEHQSERAEQIIEGCSLLLFLDTMVQFGGENCHISNLDVTLDHLPDTKLPIDLSNTKIRLSQGAHSVRFPLKWLTREPCTKLASPATADWAPGIRFADKLVSLFRALAPGRRPTIESIADAAGVPVRTIQRKLSLEGTSFFELVDTWAMETALMQFRNPNIKVSEVSKLLGYSETAHFTRAFHRWTGKTPRSYRETLC